MGKSIVSCFFETQCRFANTLKRNVSCVLLQRGPSHELMNHSSVVRDEPVQMPHVSDTVSQNVSASLVLAIDSE